MATESFRRKSVLVACHSWGGVAMMSLLRHRKLGPHARESICAVAFLDSVHRHPEPAGLSRLLLCVRNVTAMSRERSFEKVRLKPIVFATKCGWVKSGSTFDRSLRRGRYEQGTPYVSAGTNDHDRVPSFSEPLCLSF